MTGTTESRTGAEPCPDDVLLARYRLVDRVGDVAGTTVWRAYDERLRRAVSIRLAPLEADVSTRLRAAAVDASRVTDRRAVPVLGFCASLAALCLVLGFVGPLLFYELYRVLAQQR